MDRVIVYPSQLPAAEDFLAIQRETLRTVGILAASMTGGGAVVEGLDCSPTAPASMAVRMTGGYLYSPAVLDGQAFGMLPAELENSMKLGRVGETTLPISAPSSPGTEVVYLVQCAFQETDAVPAVLDYYNAANPAQPWSGPGNSGQQQFTRRQTRVALGLKAGALAAPGQAVPPAADLGWLPLWLIRVGAGAVSITSANITPHPQAPRFRSRLTTGLTAADVSGFATQAALAQEAQARGAGDASVLNALSANVNALNASIAEQAALRSQGDVALNQVVLGLRDILLAGTYDGNGGRQRMPNGMIIQWGQGVLPASGFSTSVEFRPFLSAFPTGCMCVVATPGGNQQFAGYNKLDSDAGCNPVLYVKNLEAGGFICEGDSNRGGEAEFDRAVPYNYIAIGW